MEGAYLETIVFFERYIHKNAIKTILVIELSFIPRPENIANKSTMKGKTYVYRGFLLLNVRKEKSGLLST